MPAAEFSRSVPRLAPDGQPRVRLSCPRCGLSITPRTSWLTVEHCPRCIARSRIPVRLIGSAQPAGLLDATGSVAPPEPSRLAPRTERRLRVVSADGREA